MSLQPGGGLAVDPAFVAGVVLLAALLAAVAAALYRWYAGVRIQEGLAVLIGLSAVAVLLNTTTALGQVIGRTGGGLFDLDAALVNVAAFLLAGVGTLAGRAVGDRLAVEASVLTGRREVDVDLSRLVTSVGRAIAVRIPEEVEDIDGYDPVPAETKATFAGKTLLFPRRLTVAELEERFRTRLVDDYGVGHVDVEFDGDGRIEYLAVGSRAAGLGPTLPPGTAAVAVRADPPYAASSGDVVELWRTDPEPERVATAELRGTAGDVVTVALEEAEARALESDGPYRLVTRTASGEAAREFAGVLRAADETLGAVTVAPGSELVGTALAAVEVAVVAVQPADGELLAVPSRDRTFAAGDVVYAVGRPAALRGLETAASAPEPEPSS
ncbi:MAG: potassium transporter TrkA [Halobacteriales archaeon]|nr:potassium transporter TrkA [Halobacteriales archaeon]